MPEHEQENGEHELIQEITMPFAALPEDPIRIAAEVDFPVVLRGYDRIAVDSYVKKTTKMVSDLQATRSPEAAVRRALERVGEQVSGVLQRAHETAEQITEQARVEAEGRLEAARAQADRIATDARTQVKQLDVDTDRIWAERHRIVGDVHKLAGELSDLAHGAAERFPPEEPTVESGALAPEALAPDAMAPAPEALAPDALAPAPDAQTPDALAPAPDAQTPDARTPDALAPAPTTGTPSPEREAMRVIDLMHLGRERVIGCWQVGDVLVDPGPTSCLETLLAALASRRPRALLLTHIHLDHAGATGSLVALWPDLEVYVHERGAAHLVDPSRLVQSATRLYGADMNRRWGEVLPVPESQLRILQGGETIEGIEGGFEVAYTPGHASHHVSYLHDGTAFTGDVTGVRITPSSPAIPPTPPPEIDLEAWHQSLELIRAWAPKRLAITHFGSGEDVERQLDEVSARLDAWAEMARTEEPDAFMTRVREQIARAVGPELAATYEQAAPPDQLYAGLDRYWRKRGEGRPSLS
ncbi:MAG: MBL fold metallo-hydrolase [Solirubrobacteraceae bacterium]